MLKLKVDLGSKTRRKRLGDDVDDAPLKGVLTWLKWEVMCGSGRWDVSLHPYANHATAAIIRVDTKTLGLNYVEILKYWRQTLRMGCRMLIVV